MISKIDQFFDLAAPLLDHGLYELNLAKGFLYNEGHITKKKREREVRDTILLKKKRCLRGNLIDFHC